MGNSVTFTMSRIKRNPEWKTDVATSRRMRVIGSKNTRAELLLRSSLFALGLRYKLHDRSLPGSPDIVFPKYRTVIFVNGCFWHRHMGCHRATMPKKNVQSWQKKFNATLSRDKRVETQLNEAGWQVLTVWECEISAGAGPVAQKLRDQLLISQNQ